MEDRKTTIGYSTRFKFLFTLVPYTFSRIPFTYTLLNNADDIIIKHKHHEQDQNKHPHLLGDFPLFQADGFTGDPFNPEKDQMPAVQYGNGKEIQYPQIDA